MCYKFPGPRCSNHAKRRLRAARAEFKDARQETITTGKEEPTTREFDAAMVLQEALSEYDETPAGQKALNSLINNPEQSDKVREAARARQESGLERRENRKRAYEIVHGVNMDTAATHEHRNEDERVFNLATDLDETSGGFVDGFREKLAEKYGLSEEEAYQRYPEPEVYNLAEAGWFKDREEFMREFKEAENNGLYRGLRPMEGLAGHMKKLVAEDNVAIHVLTARNKEFNKDTVAWLQANQVPYLSVRHEDNKPSVQGMHAFIDDAPYQIKGLTEAGHEVIIFQQKTNASLDGHRVQSWKEVSSVIRLIKPSR